MSTASTVTTGGVRFRQPATGRRTGDASLNGATDVPRGADQIPETVIVTTLRASCGGHHPIMIAPTGRATGRMAINGPDRLKWRELAHKSAECLENQLGWNRAVASREAV